MLQSLLPGFRHLRAPLVAGYIWLLGLWLLLREPALQRGPSEEIHDSVVELANWAGRPATFAAITLAAYVIGILSIAITRAISALIYLIYRTRFKRILPRYWINKRIESSLEAAIDRRLSEHYMDDPQFRDLLTRHLSECRIRASSDRRHHAFLFDDLPHTSILEKEALQDDITRLDLVTTLVNTFQYLESGKEDLRHLAYRLLGTEEQVYAEYDRLKSEGMFRFGLALPLAFLFFALSYVDSWWWLAGLPIPLILSYLGGGSIAQAEQGLAASVSSGRVELPSLERIRTRDVALEPYDDLIDDHKQIEMPPPYLQPKRWYSGFISLARRAS